MIDTILNVVFLFFVLTSDFLRGVRVIRRAAVFVSVLQLVRVETRTCAAVRHPRAACEADVLS